MKTRFITFLLLFVMNLGAFAQSPYQPAEENLKARQEFQDNKFGIFLHWGLYAMLATGEWTMTNNNLNYKEYAKLAGGFILFAMTTLFSFITLPVEINASKRALVWLSSSGITNSYNHAQAEDALRSAAYTYVVAALGSLATLVYYIMIFMGRRD